MKVINGTYDRQMSRTRNLAVSVVIGGEQSWCQATSPQLPPFCFKTGPGYQKCVVSGHDLTPIYQGPRGVHRRQCPVGAHIHPAGRPPAIPPDAAPNPIDTLATWSCPASRTRSTPTRKTRRPT